MAVAGISSLAALISNPSPTQGQDAPAETQASPARNAAAGAAIQDTFTPSSQNPAAAATAQDAGLFEVSPSALATATTALLSSQTVTVEAAPVAPPEQVAPTTANPAATQPAATAVTPSLQVPAAANAPAPVAAQIAPVAAPAATPATATVAPTDTQAELQSLNPVLTGFGLSNNDIQQIDLAASLTKDYNPTLYSNLIQQFQAQAAEQNTAPAGANAQPGQTKPATG